MLDRQMKLLLRLGAGVIAALAVTALIAPSTVADVLGIPLDLDPQITLWNIRVCAATLLILAGFMALAAAFLPERGLRQSGALMVVFALLLSILLIIAPMAWRWGRILAIALAVAFIALYLKALRARRRHR